MFLLVSVRHVGAHSDERQHGVSIQISINLGTTFLRISRMRNSPLIWILARVFVYLPPFIFQILDFIYWTVLIFILIYFEWLDWKPAIKIFVYVTYGGYAIFVRYVGVEAKVRKLPLRLSAGVVCRPPPIFKRNLGRRKKLAEKVGRRKIYSPVPPPSKNNWWHGGLNVSKTLQVQLTTSLQRIPLLIC